MATSDPARIASKFFDKIGMKYEEAYGHDPGLINFIKIALDAIPEKAAVLDIGCGTGKPVAGMIAASGRQVYGIDDSSTMVTLSKNQVPAGLFEEISMFDFEPKISFDAVFAVFCFFNMDGDLLGPFMKKINSWMVPNGHFFIGTMAADDFPAKEKLDSEDKPGGCHITTRFMGADAATLVYSKKALAAMLHEAGFEVFQSKTVPFQAPSEADCGLEPHYYIMARKTANK